MNLNTALSSLILIVITCCGCSKTPDGNADYVEHTQTPSAQIEPINVVATVGMVADLVREIGGERVKVVQLMGPAVDPHLHTPSRDDVARLMQADLIFCVGLMLEGKMNDTLTKLAKTKTIIAVGETLATKDLIESGDHTGTYDPHIWMDINLWIQCAESIRKTLAEHDPDNQPEYDQRINSLRQRMEQLHEYGLQVIQSIPKSKRILITSHDAFQYFGRAYGLRVQGVQGISTESEAGLQRINELVTLIVETQVPSVFTESSVNGKSLAAIVEGVHSKGQTLKSGGPLYSDAMGPPGTYEGTYLGMLDHNLTIISSGLGGKPPEKGWQNKLSYDPTILDN